MESYTTKLRAQLEQELIAPDIKNLFNLQNQLETSIDIVKQITSELTEQKRQLDERLENIRQIEIRQQAKLEELENKLIELETNKDNEFIPILNTMNVYDNKYILQYLPKDKYILEIRGLNILLHKLKGNIDNETTYSVKEEIPEILGRMTYSDISNPELLIKGYVYKYSKFDIKRIIINCPYIFSLVFLKEFLAINKNINLEIHIKGIDTNLKNKYQQILNSFTNYGSYNFLIN